MTETDVADWAVWDILREPADYDPRLELISFCFSYQDCPSESLDRIPFAKGTSDQELYAWLANKERPAPIGKPKGASFGL